jgi:uncharacterized protein with beta-barrel porin domain
MKAVGSQFRARVLGTTALVALGGLTLGTGSAGAACSNSTPAAGETVTCSGAVVDPVETVAAGVTVILDSTADFNINDIYAIGLGDDGTVTLNGDAGSSAQIYAASSEVVGIEGRENLSVTLNAASQVVASGIDSAIGIYGRSGSRIELNGTSSVAADAPLGYYAAGILLDGDGSTVTLNNQSAVLGYGAEDAAGLLVNGDGNTFVLNDEAGILAIVTNSGVPGEALGIAMIGDDNSVSLNGDNTIIASVDDGFAEYAAGIFTIGRDTVITLNETSQVSAGLGNGAVVYAMGGILAGGPGARTITLNDAASVQVGAYDSFGYLALGIGFGNVAYVGAGGTLTLNDTSRVNVAAISSSAYVAGGVVANANDANIVLNATSAIDVYLDDSLVPFTTGLWAMGDDNLLTLNDASGVSVTLYDSQSFIVSAAGVGDIPGIGVPGTGGTLTLNGTARLDLGIVLSDATAAFAALALTDDATIVLNGASSANTYVTDSSEVDYAGGVYATGDGNTILLNDSASVDVAVTPNVTVNVGLSGIGVRGDNNDIVMNGSASVTLDGFSSGYVAAGVMLAGTGNTLTLNGNATIDVTPSVYAHGVSLGGGTGNAVVLNGNASIAGSGRGIYARNEADLTILLGQGTSVSGATGIQTSNATGADIRVAGEVTGTFVGIVLSGDGNTLTLDTGASVEGGIYAFAGENTLALSGEGELGTITVGFSHLNVDATGIWNLSGILALDDTFGPGAATLNSGTTLVNGVLQAPGGVTVGADGTLGGGGTIIGDVVNFGTLAPGNSPGTLAVTGDFDFGAGSVFEVEADATATDLLTATNDITIDPSSTVNIQFLGGVDGFDATILTAGNTLTGTFGAVTGGAGALTYTPTTVSLLAMRPTSLNGALTGGLEAGFAFLDALTGQARHGLGGAGRLWATGIAEDGKRNADGTGGAFDSKTHGGAFGGDVYSEGAASIGVAAGYLDSSIDASGGGSSTDIRGFHLGAYGSWSMGNGFVTGALGGSWQDQKTDRRVLAGGLATASASPDAWSVGAGLVAGHAFPLEGNWTLTPLAHLAYQRLERDGYSETGGGTAAIGVGSQTAETLRAGFGAELGVEIRDPNASWSVRPALRAGIGREMQLGDATVGGSFLSTGAPFTATLDTRDQTVLTGGVGIDVEIGNGISGFLSWDGRSGDAGSSSAFTIGARLTW